MVQAKVASLIAALTGVDPADITLDKTMRELKVDTFGLVDIMMELEEEYDIFVDDSVMIKTVKDIVQCFEEAHPRSQIA